MAARTILPLGLDLTDATVGLIGRDRQALNRLAFLSRFQVARIAVWSDAPSPALLRALGRPLPPGLPDSAAIRGLGLLLIADLAPQEAQPFAAMARAARVPVNAEDIPELCDVHVPAVVTRGDLTVAISTRGQAPGLASLIRRHVDEQIGPEWEPRVAEVQALRQALRREGVPPAEVARRIARHVSERGWLPASA